MKEITLTNAKLRYIGSVLINWDTYKDQIHLGGRSLYALIGIKRLIGEKNADIDSTIRAIADQYQGEVRMDGSVKFPDDKLSEVNDVLQEAMNTEVGVTYLPININETDSLPPELMEVLFDFIEIE